MRHDTKAYAQKLIEVDVYMRHDTKAYAQKLIEIECLNEIGIPSFCNCLKTQQDIQYVPLFHYMSYRTTEIIYRQPPLRKHTDQWFIYWMENKWNLWQYVDLFRTPNMSRKTRIIVKLFHLHSTPHLTEWSIFTSLMSPTYHTYSYFNLVLYDVHYQKMHGPSANTKYPHMKCNCPPLMWLESSRYQSVMA